ncbi:MAG: helix-turn-helix transcriptional regulator [Ruminococcaceae bacterium]|nr:helix-turn-helix transcriptional regulator [Oscillospiraceae bacterium]
MKTIFNMEKKHTITEANVNFYATPLVHPSRCMQEHDFIYMLQGEWIMGQNGEHFRLQNDSLLILTAGCQHYGVKACPPETKTMFFHVSCEAGDMLVQDDKICSLPHAVCIDTFNEAGGNKNIKKYFSEIVNCKLYGNQKKADAWFDLLLCELAQSRVERGENDVAMFIENIIHNNPERFFSNRRLAQMAKTSLKTAETKFKAQFGVTIHQYMLSYKVEQAIFYFKTFPDMSMKEIAYSLGFYDEYHFSKQFKKVMGTSPSEYKKQETR